MTDQTELRQNPQSDEPSRAAEPSARRSSCTGPAAGGGASSRPAELSFACAITSSASPQMSSSRRFQLRAFERCGEDSRIGFECLDRDRRGLERHRLLERFRDGRELRARSLHLRETKSTLRSLLLSYFTHIRLAFAPACGRFACRREALVPHTGKLCAF